MKAKGTIVWNPKGYAFLVRDDGREDVFVRACDLMGAMHGDYVEGDVFRKGKGFKGRITRILSRNTLTVTGKYHKLKKWGEIEPSNPIPYPVIVPQGWESGARNGDIVTASIIPPKQGKRIDAICARIQEILNIPDTIGDDVKYVITKHSLPWGFSPEAEAEADEASLIEIDDFRSGRIDLRESVLFTIDGRNARDFDDAVGIDMLNNGNFLVTVAIADVAELVRPGSALDREALDRGFSVYFPELCLPMLPEALSNGMLSLKPGEDRLAVAIQMEVGPRGRLISTTCFEAIIRSRARLMYETASPYLEGTSDAPCGDEAVNRSLKILNRLAGHLYRARKKAGSLDFDLPEVEIEISDSGNIEDISRRPRGPAERLIEEMMLLANRAVCAYLKEHSMPILFRVHEKPAEDDLIDLSSILENIGSDKSLVKKLVKSASNGRDINRILNEIADAYREDNLEGFVHRNILRSLKQARYSTEDIGHFGLGFAGYLHFTSPIRRYSDLLVHRTLKSLLNHEEISEKGKARASKGLKKLADVISKKERSTNEAMMEAVKLKTASYMKRHVGNVFAGVVTSITPFGFFVEISNPPVDGLVRTSYPISMRQGRQKKRRGNPGQVSLGDSVEVVISRVDESKGYIDMELALPEIKHSD